MAHHRNDHSIEKISVAEEVAPIGHSNSRYVEECITRFRKWYKGQDSLGQSEECLTIPLSISDFLDLKKVLNIDEDEKYYFIPLSPRYLLKHNRFPKYCYSALSTTLAIQRMPSSIHEKAVSTVANGFSSVRKALPTNLRRKIHIVTNQVFTEFDDKYENSEKTPDTTVQITNSQGMVNIKFVLEVGLSKSYEMLVQDARLWIEGDPNVNFVMIVKMEENPPYQSPVRHLTDDQFEQHNFPEWKNINMKTFALDGEYGPASFMGLCWVGRISGFLEVWERDTASNIAKITPAGRIVSYYPSR